MQKTSTLQRKHNQKFRVLADSKQKTCIKKFMSKNDEYYKKIVKVIKSIDTTAIACTFCESTTVNTKRVTDYQSLVNKLYKVTDMLKACYPKRKPVPCTRKPVSLCNGSNYNMKRDLERYAKQLRNSNIKASNGIPKVTCKE